MSRLIFEAILKNEKKIKFTEKENNVNAAYEKKQFSEKIKLQNSICHIKVSHIKKKNYYFSLIIQ